jgi:hypothetical protein
VEISPTLIFIIIIILAPLIEKLLKAGRQQPPPPPGSRQQQRMPPPQRPRPELQRRAPAGDREEGESSAADMVPDDLWAILTGQQRPRPEPPREVAGPAAEEGRRVPTTSSRPAPAPMPTARRPAPAGKRPRPRQESAPGTGLPPAPKRPSPAGYDMRGELPPDEEASFRRTPPQEQFPVEGYVREIPVHRPPEVVSLEELVIDDAKRHESFHERLAALPGAARVRRRPRHALAERFRAQDEIRRAIIMSEVLGRPRGLD